MDPQRTEEQLTVTTNITCLYLITIYEYEAINYSIIIKAERKSEKETLSFSYYVYSKNMHL